MVVSVSMQRCSAVADTMVPLGLRHGLGVGISDVTAPGQPTRFVGKQCVAGIHIGDIHMGFYFDMEGNVSSADGEKVVYNTQKSPEVSNIKYKLNRVPGCRFTEFHSYTTDPYEYGNPRSPENHVHFACRGPYRPGEWKSVLNQLMNALGVE